MRYVAVALLAAVAFAVYAQPGMGLGPIGRFSMLPAEDGQVWLLDTATGALRRCASAGDQPACTKPSRDAR